MCDLREKPVCNIASPRLLDLEGLGLKRNQLIVPEGELARALGFDSYQVGLGVGLMVRA